MPGGAFGDDLFADRAENFLSGAGRPTEDYSIAAQQGQVCFLWLEEAFEVSREEDFAILDESIRGSAPFKQLTLTFNPWNERHWLKRRFFDAPARIYWRKRWIIAAMNFWTRRICGFLPIWRGRTPGVIGWPGWVNGA